MPASETQITRFYNQEEIQQILACAIAKSADDAEFTREQLAEIATELGISTDCLQAAEREWLAKQGDLRCRQDFNTYRRSQLQKYVGKYAIVNSFLVPLNFISTGQLSWSLYILLLWGLGLALKAWNTYQCDGEEYERAFQLWYRKHQMRQSFSTFFSKLFKTADPLKL